MVIEQDVVMRYRKTYGLSDAIDAGHVEQHLELETALTKKLWESTPENRWQVFDDCYTTLYKGLPWLNSQGAEGRWRNDGPWPRLLKKRSTVFEIGSGAGELIRRLASLGHRCVATEITIERGEKHVKDINGLEWRSTDGVHLTRFEKPGTYDVVISSQVVEHLHPDDVSTHFENVRIVLKDGGEYIFDTPHSGTGPHDLSKVFQLDRPAFCHLREYDFRSLGRIAKVAGFRKVRAILYHQRSNAGPLKSQWLFHYYCFVDLVLSKARLSQRAERRLRRCLRLALVPGNIWLAVQK
jgi:2-polyprenyl-3-methyl-5-hydroxy-6-metoxy-1,4-benzoquinol methylase